MIPRLNRKRGPGYNNLMVPPPYPLMRISDAKKKKSRHLQEPGITPNWKLMRENLLDGL
jgi:hypothetical protein